MPSTRWTGLIFGLMAGTLLLYAVAILWQPVPDGASVLIQKLASAGIWFGAAALCMVKARASRRERTEWRLFALAAGLWGSGSAYYSVFQWNLDVVPVPSFADAFWIAFYIPAYLAISRLLRKRAGAFGRAVWLDAMIGGLGVGGAAALVVFTTVLDQTTGSTIAVITDMAYPIGDLGLLTLLVAAMTVLGWRGSGVLRWIAPAFAVFAVADSFYLVQVANGTYMGSGVVDLGWPLAALLIGFAAWRAESPPVAEARTRTVVGVPEAVGIAALVLLVYDHFLRASVAVVVLAAVSLAAILIRLHLVVRENNLLLGKSRSEAMTDSLTGLGNRRQLAADLAQYSARLDPSRPLVLTLFDLDGFKQYNDTFGHPAGDQLLRLFGGRLTDLVSGLGTAYRMGGDEFCAVWHLWDANIAELTPKAAAMGLSERGEGFSIGCSYGSVILPADTSAPSEALRLADHRMYVHKRSGRASAGRQSADVLQQALAERHSGLGDHMGDVAELATRTAITIGCSPDVLDLVRDTALLHDIGKVAIPDEILSKPGPLNGAEWACMKGHTIIGERIISAAPSLAAVAGFVRSTHESFDGRGYPDGLAGEEIPVVARIVAVCDAYDAMVAARPYRPARRPQEALAELRRCSGTQFDPAVVEAFVHGLKAYTPEDPPIVRYAEQSPAPMTTV